MTEDQVSLFNDNAEYDAFIEKFKPKKTTDDCYTQPVIFKAIRDWACREYGIDPARIIRPFYPGGDYEHEDYPDGCVVLDNPPFSILSQITKFYQGRGIRFFLFAPALTVMNLLRQEGLTVILADAQIEYENGANVNTGFVTNMDRQNVARSVPELAAAIHKAVEITRRLAKPELPKYSYPPHVVTGAMLNKLAKYGIPFSVPRGAAVQISAMDAQRAERKAIFGSGLLLSEKAAAEKAATEKAATTVWELSEREKELIRQLE